MPENILMKEVNYTMRETCTECEHCDPKRTNDLEMVRCKRFSTYVSPSYCCDYFTNKEKREFFDKFLKR